MNQAKNPEWQAGWVDIAVEQCGTDIRGVLRGPRGPKKLKNIRRYFCE